MHTNNGFRSIRQLLESRLMDAVKANGSRESIRIQQVADPIDMTMQAAERELAMHTLDRHTLLRRQLRFAIDRIKDGTYGICRECDEAIAPKRLKAIPWALLCIGCQEKADGSPQNARVASIPTDYSKAA